MTFLKKNGHQEVEVINLPCHSKLIDANNIRKEMDQSLEVKEATDDVEKGDSVVFIT